MEALALAKVLRAEGVPLWWDRDPQTGIRPGRDFLRELEGRLRKCGGIIVLIGHGGVDRWVRAEVDAALIHSIDDDSDFRIVPVLMPGTDARSIPLLARRHSAIELEVVPSELSEGQREALVGGLKAESKAPRTRRGANPYAGLEAYSTDQSFCFFGRDRQVIRATGEFDGIRRWLYIDGDSGVGKSSFARAGILPLAPGGWIDGTPIEVTIEIRPGRDPLRNLAVALAARLELDLDTVRDKLRKRGDALASLLLQLKVRREAHGIMLLIDQLEELLSMAPAREGSEDATASPEREVVDARSDLEVFDEQLAFALADPECDLWMVTTVRSDYAHRVWKALPKLAKLREVHGRHYPLGAMTARDLQDVIQGPVQQWGLEWESGLPEKILQEVSQQPAPLVVLGELLRVLCSEAKGAVIDDRVYRAVGGAVGVIQHGMERLLEIARLELEQGGSDGRSSGASTNEDADPEAEAGAEEAALDEQREWSDCVPLTNLLLAFVRPDFGGDNLRRALTTEEARLVLTDCGLDEARADRVLGILSGQRSALTARNARRLPRILVVREREDQGPSASVVGTAHEPNGPQVDLVHERLMDVWPSYQRLITKKRRDLLRREGLENKARLWSLLGRKDEEVDASDVARVEEGFGPVTLVARSYLEAARAKHERLRAAGESKGRTLRERVALVSITLVILGVVTGSIYVALNNYANQKMYDIQRAKSLYDLERTYTDTDRLVMLPRRQHAAYEDKRYELEVAALARIAATECRGLPSDCLSDARAAHRELSDNGFNAEADAAMSGLLGLEAASSEFVHDFDTALLLRTTQLAYVTGDDGDEVRSHIARLESTHWPERRSKTFTDIDEIEFVKCISGCERLLLWVQIGEDEHELRLVDGVFDDPPSWTSTTLATETDTVLLGDLAVSPDGRWIVLAVDGAEEGRRCELLGLQSAGRPLSRAPLDCPEVLNATFSDDGRLVAFFPDGGIFDLAAGPPYSPIVRWEGAARWTTDPRGPAAIVHRPSGSVHDGVRVVGWDGKTSEPFFCEDLELADTPAPNFEEYLAGVRDYHDVDIEHDAAGRLLVVRDGTRYEVFSVRDGEPEGLRSGAWFRDDSRPVIVEASGREFALITEQTLWRYDGRGRPLTAGASRHPVAFTPSRWQAGPPELFVGARRNDDRFWFTAEGITGPPIALAVPWPGWSNDGRWSIFELHGQLHVLQQGSFADSLGRDARFLWNPGAAAISGEDGVVPLQGRPGSRVAVWNSDPGALCLLEHGAGQGSLRCADHPAANASEIEGSEAQGVPVLTLARAQERSLTIERTAPALAERGVDAGVLLTARGEGRVFRSNDGSGWSLEDFRGGRHGYVDQVDTEVEVNFMHPHHWHPDAHTVLVRQCPGGECEAPDASDGADADTEEHETMGRFQLLDIDGGRVLGAPIEAYPSQIVWADSGSRFATFEDTTVEMWDAQTGQRIWSRIDPMAPVDSVGLSPSGDCVAISDRSWVSQATDDNIPARVPRLSVYCLEAGSRWQVSLEYPYTVEGPPQVSDGGSAVAFDGAPAFVVTRQGDGCKLQEGTFVAARGGFLVEHTNELFFLAADADAPLRCDTAGRVLYTLPMDLAMVPSRDRFVVEDRGRLHWISIDRGNVVPIMSREIGGTIQGPLSFLDEEGHEIAALVGTADGRRLVVVISDRSEDVSGLEWRTETSDELLERWREELGVELDPETMRAVPLRYYSARDLGLDLRAPRSADGKPEDSRRITGPPNVDSHDDGR